MNASSDLLLHEKSEEALDLIDPGRGGRREVPVPARSFGEPILDELGFVARRVVHDYVDVEVGGHRSFDRIEELAELGGPMPRHAATDDAAGFHVEGGK